MFKSIKCSSRTLTLLLCYPMLAIGQYWLVRGYELFPSLHDRLTIGARDWAGAHLVLTVSMLLLFKGYLAISDYVRPTRAAWMASYSVFLTAITVFVLIGQYAIDLALVEVYKMPREMAEQTLLNIRSNSLIRFLYLEPGAPTGGFQRMLLPMLANLLMGMAFWFSGKMPRWSAVVFSVAFCVTNLCAFTQLGFGGWLHTAGYLLYSIAFIPVALGLWQTPVLSESGQGSKMLTVQAG